MKDLVSKGFVFYQSNISKIIYYTCIITLGVVFIERLFIIFSYEAHTAGIDNNFDYPIIRSLAGFSLYPDPEDYPYAVNPYAPLFFILCKWVAFLLNVNPMDTITVYWVSRSVSLLADIGTCFIFFRMLKQHIKASNFLSIACISLFFCIISFLGYTINRSDSLFLFFYCCTIYTLIRFSKSNTIWTPILSAALTTLCIFSKQNGISLLVLVPAWYYFGKNYRSIVVFLISAAFFITFTFLYFEYVYTNHHFSSHIIDALKNKIDPRWFYIYVFKLMASTYLTLLIAASLIIALKSIAENNQSMLRRLGILCILQFLISTALSFKWGSSLGYYNESFLLGFIVIATYCTIVIPHESLKRISSIAVYSYPALFIFIFHMTAQLYFFFLNDNIETKNIYKEQVQIGSYIKKAIGTENKYVIDLSDANLNFFKNILFKESAAPNIDAVWCCTLPDSIFNYSGLLEGLKNGKIMFLIKGKDAVVNNVWGVDIQHYRKDTTFTKYSIYRYDDLSAIETK